MDSKVVKSSVTRTEGSSKRAGVELESDKSKKQKIDEHIQMMNIKFRGGLLGFKDFKIFLELLLLRLVLTELEDSYKDGDGDTAFQLSRIHYHMLMLKLQRHTISIKIQVSRKLNESVFGFLQNGKLIYNYIMHGPNVRRIILEPGDPDREVPVAETFHEQTDEELIEKEVKQMEGDDQAI
ncbi:hypothetical protein Tco_0834946 [Tanacetum coccineum]